MATTTFSDTMVSGDTREFDITVEDPQGNAVDIRSTEIVYALSADVGSTPPDIEKTVAGGGITITDGVNGKFTIRLDATDTKSLSGDNYHECELTDTSGDVTTLFYGTLSIRQDLINP